MRTSSTNDAAAHLQIGAEQGGLEISAYAMYRPAPTGVTLSPHSLTGGEALVAAANAAVSLYKYDSAGTALQVVDPTTTISPTIAFTAGSTLAERLAQLRDFINAIASDTALVAAGESFPWRAELWGWRLAVVPTDGPIRVGR